MGNKSCFPVLPLPCWEYRTFAFAALTSLIGWLQPNLLAKHHMQTPVSNHVYLWHSYQVALGPVFGNPSRLPCFHPAASAPSCSKPPPRAAPDFSCLWPSACSFSAWFQVQGAASKGGAHVGPIPELAPLCLGNLRVSVPAYEPWHLRIPRALTPGGHRSPPGQAVSSFTTNRDLD